MTAPPTSNTVVSLPTDRQILITREFAAPPQFVYAAWTTPDLIRRWWHAKRGEVTSVEVDLRVGGKWRQAMVTPDGFEVAFHGEYRELVPNELIVCTEVYEGAPDDEALDTIRFIDLDGRTRIELLVEHGTAAARDMHIASGMEAGLRDAMDLLEETAISLA